MRGLLFLFISIGTVFCILGGPSDKQDHYRNENVSYKYTFYDDVGSLILIDEPEDCYPRLYSPIEMWHNKTYNCDHKLTNMDQFVYMQAIEGFPYIKLFMCNIDDKHHYYPISNCFRNYIEFLVAFC